MGGAEDDAARPLCEDRRAYRPYGADSLLTIIRALGGNVGDIYIYAGACRALVGVTLN